MEDEQVTLSAQNELTGERAKQLSDSGLANYNRGSQFYPDAQRNFADALRVKEQIYGLNSVQVAETLEQLASIHKAMKDYAGAAKHLERAINTFDSLDSAAILPVSITPEAMKRKLEDLSDLYKVAGQSEDVLRVEKLISERAK